VYPRIDSGPYDWGCSVAQEKGKPEETQGRKATGPRLNRHSLIDPKIAGLPNNQDENQGARR